MRKINVITLGCSKNTVDSEHLMARLAAAGYSVVHDSDRTDAKTVVINTCGFIGDAKQESIDMILRAAAAKQAGRIERLFVVGCLSERYADELRQEIPEVDEYFGARTWDGIVRALGAAEDPELATERRLTTPKHYAYLKIAEGCNWKCGYCAIPLIRGEHRSVPMEELEEEARKLAAQGVRELMVIAQDTTYYGIDLYGRRALGELLQRLCRIDGIEWIRLHYAYPAAFPADVIDTMASEPKICKYLDIPFQHISDAQLRSMRRRHTKAEAMELIRRLREAVPDLALRTTLLVGYPGETEDDFAQLLDFVREVRFERLGVFALLGGGGDLFGPGTARRRARSRETGARRTRHGLAERDFAREQPPPRRPDRTRHHRLAAGRLLRGPHAVRLARGGPGDPHPGSGPAAPARPVLRRADHLGGRLRSLRRNKPVSHSPRSQAGDAASEARRRSRRRRPKPEGLRNVK